MDGIIPFLKPPGITSHDAVAVCRRLLKEKKIGHSGTLDPMAFGVLPMFVGKATRLIEYTDSWDKTYVAEACFGFSTDTEDSSGEILERVTITRPPTWEDIQACAASFVGEQAQVPSIYSAIKINGKRAYEYAREGITVTMPSRQITVYEVTVLAYAFPYVTLRISCSAGTYIRSLLRDMGSQLGAPLTMTQLARTKVGPFTTSDCYCGEELLTATPLETHLAVSHLPRLDVSAGQAQDLKQGKQVSVRALAENILENQLYQVFVEDLFVGMCRGTRHSLRAEKILL